MASWDLWWFPPLVFSMLQYGVEVCSRLSPPFLGLVVGWLFPPKSVWRRLRVQIRIRMTMYLGQRRIQFSSAVFFPTISIYVLYCIHSLSFSCFLSPRTISLAVCFKRFTVHSFSLGFHLIFYCFLFFSLFQTHWVKLLQAKTASLETPFVSIPLIVWQFVCLDNHWTGRCLRSCKQAAQAWTFTHSLSSYCNNPVQSGNYTPKSNLQNYKRTRTHLFNCPRLRVYQIDRDG